MPLQQNTFILTQIFKYCLTLKVVKHTILSLSIANNFINQKINLKKKHWGGGGNNTSVQSAIGNIITNPGSGDERSTVELYASWENNKAIITTSITNGTLMNNLPHTCLY